MAKNRNAAIGVGSLVAFVLAIAIAPPAAQAPPVIIGSSTAGLLETSDDQWREQDLVVHPHLRLVEISNSAVDLAALKRLRRQTVGPFDQTALGFRFIDVYFDRTLPPADDRDEHSANGTLRLIIATRQSSRATRWWLLERSTAEPDEEGLRLEPLSIDDEPDDQELVRLATNDRSLPILDIQYGSHEFGANAGSQLERHLLVDFRPPVPRVIALLDNVDASGGGACTAFDAIYSARREVGCRWDGARGDFRCAETIHDDSADWVERRGTRDFFLESGQPVASQAGNPMTLAELAERAVKTGSGSTEVARLGSYGPTTVVATLSFGRATVVVLGSPLLSKGAQVFGVRLHAAVVEPDRETRLQEILPRVQVEDPPKANAPSQTHTPDGFVATFRSQLLAESDFLKILQLTVAEGDARGVYLLGLDYSRQRLRTDSLLVATDGPTYDHCKTWILPATAVGMVVRADPFAAVLDVEPANVEEFDGDTDEWMITPRKGRTCRAAASATWQAGSGFVLEWQRQPCRAPEQPRRVVIDDQGRLTSSNRATVERPRR